MMKPFLAAAILSVGALSMTTFTSCSKDDKTCAEGYEGSNCNTKASQKFIGTWNVEEVSVSGSDSVLKPNYQITVLATNSTSPTDVIVQNLNTDGPILNGSATANSKSLSVEPGTLNNMTYNVTKYTLNDNGKITLQYTVTDTADNVIRNVIASLSK